MENTSDKEGADRIIIIIIISTSRNQGTRRKPDGCKGDGR